MIPDFPLIKAKIEKVVNKHFRETVKQNSPFISMMSRRTLYEGNKMGVIYQDGKHIVNELKTVHTEFAINHDEIPELKPDEFISKVSNAAEDISIQMERGMIDSIEEIVEMSGNVISNEKIGPDLVLRMFEKLKFTFENDDRQKPNKVSIFSSLEAYQKLADVMANMTEIEKEDYKRKEEKILNRKYEEYIRDILSRQLID